MTGIAKRVINMTAPKTLLVELFVIPDDELVELLISELITSSLDPSIILIGIEEVLVLLVKLITEIEDLPLELMFIVPVIDE